MNKKIYQLITAVFFANMAISSVACSGGGCGKKEEQKEETETPMKFTPAHDPKVGRPGVSGPGNSAAPTAVKSGISSVNSDRPLKSAPAMPEGEAPKLENLTETPPETKE